MAAPTATHAPAPARPARGGGARPARAPARGGGGGPAPAKGAKVGANPATRSPRFQKALERLNESAAKGRSHPPPGKKAAEAQAAAQGPVNEKLAGAKSNQVDSMSQAPTGKPEESSFLQLLEAEIEKVIPKTMGETEKFMKGEKKEQLQGSLQGNIAQQKQQATAGLQGATAAAPDPSGVPAKEVTPIPAEAKVIPPAIGASGAIPVRKPDSEVSLQKSKDDVKTTLERERITEKQLQKANDPRFSAVLKEKGKVEAQADAGPRQYRKKEGAALGSAMARASADEKAAIAGFGGARDTSGAEVKKSQLGAKERDELRRKEVADNIEKIFTETKESVEDKLAKLDTEVSEKWDRMMNGAVQQMTTYVNLRLDAYKDDRYGGLFGWALWIKDKLLGLPDDVNVFYEDGRKLFRQLLQTSVRVIAADVENRLAEAKGEIEKGRKRVRDYVEALPKDLQAVGTAAEAEVKARFEDLERAVDDKKQEMANTLAQRAKDAYDASEKALKEIQDANKGLIAKFIEAVGEVLEVLAEIVSMLGRILVKAASAIGDIVSDPVGFLGNLLSAVKRGIGQFRDRFWDHLKAGFLEWMFGAMGEAGIEVPKDFTLGSVLKLVLQVLGLTWDNIRPRIVKLVGPRGMALLEKAYEVIGVLWKGGFAALWDHLKEYLGDLKEKIVGELKDFLVVTIVKAAITKIATMFNPAGALIQAIITIYNTVMFFIENIRRILAFVESVIDSIARIAKGDVGGAADYIESAMARTVPIIIAFLARLLGVSGVAQRVRSAINKLRAMVSKGIDKVLEKLVAGLKSMFGGDKAKAEEKKPGEAGANAAQAPDTTRDVSTPLANHPHTLRAAVTGGRLQFLMASNGFAALESRLDEILNQECPPATVTRWRDEKTNYQRRSRPVPAQLQQKLDRYDALKTRIRDLKTEIQQHAQSYTAQPDAAAKQRVFDRALGESTRMLIIIRDDFKIVSGELSSLVVPHEHSMNALGVKSHGRSGGMHATIGPNSPARPTSPSGTVPGTSIFGYSRGHLLAASLGGPNSAGAAGWNFAAMDQQTNTTSAGMQAPEQAGRNAINAGVVLDYSVIPHYEPNAAAFDTWLTANLATAVPNPANVLFIAAQNNNTNRAHLGSVLQLGGPIPAALYPPLLLRLAYYFLPHHFTVTITVVRQPSGVAFTLPSGVQGNRQNHMGKSPKPCP